MRRWCGASRRPLGALQSQLGVGRGDRVAILSANHPDYLVLLYACARLGAMLVPINWRLAVPEQLYILHNAGVKVLVVEQAFAAVVDAADDGAARRAQSSASISRLSAGRSFADLLQAPAATGAARQSIQPGRCSSSTPRGPPGIRRARCCARRR